ncbi:MULTISPECIES: hypothetical protein [Enterobacterales]|uniref:hypothetical protein n=1 Tax=Enterobacterales TaxID=91347 RepID=UPI000F83DE51|nr:MULTISPECIES: hypothetical protein [Enterobacterales]MBJ8363540.1 hypothetical protein [Citrobacter cronae]MCS4320298.1 nucleoside 2-deoxyribosyltransferase [Serratia sp. BIGb0234]RTM64970.1 hypothetical protein EKO17_10285 [Enterobacter hormaechei subsp. xiangfangensis]
MSQNTLLIVTIAMALVSTLALVFSLLIKIISKSKNDSYDEYRKQAYIEMMRESYEKQIYSLNKQMMSNEKRWEDINHLLVESQYKNASRKDSDDDFFKNLGINKNEIVEKRQVFVLTPFNEVFDDIYEDVKSIVSSTGIPCTRGDEEIKTGNILSHIVQLLLESKIIIANIDGRNANVFYELGIAHALGKKTILISSDLSQVPFDMKTQRILFYTHKSELKDKLLPYLVSSI